MRACIHRLPAVTGGNAVEVEAADGNRLVLDLGGPPPAAWDDDAPLAPTPGLVEPDDSVLGVLVVHAHLDHYRLAANGSTAVPLYSGREAESLQRAAALLSPVPTGVRASGHLRHRQPFVLGPFTVTPYLTDHSAFDAYCLLVEADGARLFSTGDLRGNGRKAAMFERLLADPPDDIDVLLVAGTALPPAPGGDGGTPATDPTPEARLAELSRETTGAVVVISSARNLDGLVSVHRVAQHTGRSCVVGPLGATVAAATRSTIPLAGHHALRVYVPQRQRLRVKQTREFFRGQEVRRVFEDELAADPARWMFHLPPSTVGELLTKGILDARGVAVSLGHGRLSEAAGLQERLDDHGVALVTLPAPGRAPARDLRRLVDALEPGRVIPVHDTDDRLAQLCPGVELPGDRQWWELRATPPAPAGERSPVSAPGPPAAAPRRRGGSP